MMNSAYSMVLNCPTTLLSRAFAPLCARVNYIYIYIYNIPIYEVPQHVAYTEQVAGQRDTGIL